jgi:hypothetical protein
MTPVTFTGAPDKSVGENLAWLAACTAACCKSGWPVTARAEITLPDSSIVTCTVTVPEACVALAIGGYAGFGRLMALPLSTPPEMGALGPDEAVGFGGGGGGGSSTATVEGEGVSISARWCGSVVEVLDVEVSVSDNVVAFSDGDVVFSERVVFRAACESVGSPPRIINKPMTMAESPKIMAPIIQGSAFDLRAALGAVVLSDA